MKQLISSGRNVFIPTDGSYETPLFSQNENSKSAQLWIEMLEKEGLCTDSGNANFSTLFEYVKQGFESKFGCQLEATLVSQYIAGDEGNLAVKHDQASRAFTVGNTVYIDKLIVDALFDYIANYYLWARYGSEVFPFCFKYALKTLDPHFRQGYLGSDNSACELLELLKTKGDDKAYVLIADLYWCALAFIMCHELAHIYIDEITDKRDIPMDDSAEENLADEYGYKVFLHMIEGINGKIDSPFASVFHSYLYAAPMILFLFYEDLYFMGNWVYGEKIEIKEHLPFSSRIENLLALSREWEADIDLAEGDDVLKNYWAVSDLFREELVYKVKNGKLSKVIQEGYRNMKNISGYEQALQYDMYMQEQLKLYAISENIDPKKMIGLYNIAVNYEVLDENGAAHEFIHTSGKTGGKLVSTKPYNLRFRLAASLSAIIETGITLFTPGETIPTIMQLVKIVISLLDESSIELSEEQAKVLLTCYQLKAFHSSVPEEVILQQTASTSKVIDELCRLRCIELIDGNVKLVEEVVLN